MIIKHENAEQHHDANTWLWNMRMLNNMMMLQHDAATWCYNMNMKHENAEQHDDTTLLWNMRILNMMLQHDAATTWWCYNSMVMPCVGIDQRTNYDRNGLSLTTDFDPQKYQLINQTVTFMT
jgi:hypothetical protein